MYRKLLLYIFNIPYKFINIYRQYRRIISMIKKKRSFGEFYLEKKYFVTNNDEIIFSLRDFGGSTAERGRNFFIKEKLTVDWIKNFDKNSNFLDIGSNIGIYSLYAGKLKHKVLSIEPESLNFALLNLNINDNNLKDNILSYPFSAYSKNSINKLNIYNMFWGKSGHQFKQDFSKLNKNAINYHLQGSYGITIDTLIEHTGFIPKYIKIDIDGLELEAVKGMKNTLNRKVAKSILIEINNEEQSGKEIFEIMKNNGYKIFNSEMLSANSANYFFKIN